MWRIASEMKVRPCRQRPFEPASGCLFSLSIVNALRVPVGCFKCCLPGEHRKTSNIPIRPKAEARAPRIAEVSSPAYAHELSFLVTASGGMMIMIAMSDHCCEAQWDIAELEARQRRVLIAVLVINVITFVMMVVGSILSGSSSLLSGTLDNLGDALTYALSLAVIGASSRTKARVAFLKGLLILTAAIVVAGHISWRLTHLEAPVVTTMGLAALLNLGANAFCLLLLSPFRHSDVNMSSVWECSRNDVIEGTAVIATAVAVWLFDSGWPDILVAIALLVLFLRSAARVLGSAWRELGRSPRDP